jgi:hypothetical protein
MSAAPYIYERRFLTRYTFISKGKKGAVTKIVEFTPTSNRLILNVAFGDLLDDGTMDDKSNTNNGDIVKVLATVIEIIKDFTNEYRNSKIIFTGSTIQRTKLYHRILNSYYTLFNREFVLSALIEVENKKYLEIPFEPGSNDNKYIAFFVKRK